MKLTLSSFGRILVLLVTANLIDNVHNADDFIWSSIVNLSTKTLQKGFLPNYIDVENDIIYSKNISVACQNDFQMALDAIKRRQLWPFRMFDSWGKLPPSGSLSGTLTDFGDYDQCLGIEEMMSEYCLIDLKVPMPEPMPKYHNYYLQAKVLPDQLEKVSDQVAKHISNGSIFRYLSDKSSVFYYVNLQIGVCLPESCTKSDIETIAHKNSYKIGLKLKQITCESKKTAEWKPNLAHILAICLIVVSLTITLSAAMYDRFVCQNKADKSAINILLWFSPFRNIRKLVCTKSYDDLTCVHGLRFITMVWIIICHTLEWNNLNMFRDTFSIREKLTSLNKQPLYKGHYTVDTFFYLSGLLTSYVTIKYTNGDYKNFRYSSFLLLRFLRLTPQLATFLLISSLMPQLFDGPLWQSYVNKVADKCYITWWHNLIYLHNLIDVGNICAIHTWYLSADMQLHWMSLIPIVILLKNRYRGILFVRLLILVCVAVVTVTIYMGKMPPGGVITSKNDFLDENGVPSDFIKLFYKPWAHANVFFIGFIFGAFIQNTNLENRILKKSAKYFYWLVTFAGYLFCMYSTVPWLYGRPYNPFWSAILFSLDSTIWASTLTLLIWLCITKNGTIIGRILSWSGFRPLSRLTYAVYLTHAWVVWVALGTRRELIDLNTRSILLLCSGVILIAYLVGFVFTILFETPLIHLIEYIKNNWLEQKSTFIDSKVVNNNNGNKREKEIKLLEIQSSNL